MIYTKYTDYRITLTVTADALAKAYKSTLLLKVQYAGEQTAYYVFGKRVLYIKRMQRKEGMPLHFDLTHFTAVTIGGRKFLYCPVGNICSWSEGDVDNKWCHYCKKWFNEIK